jgi:hypothetical protein
MLKHLIEGTQLMSIYQQIYDTFVEHLGEPSSENSLKEYITFVFEKSTSKGVSETYCEDHHIIPACIFENDMLFTLRYENHVQAHVLLAYAYPISKFLRPLNFMLNRTEKESIEFRKMWSRVVKDWWKDFRKSDNYKQWTEKRHRYLKSEKNLKHLREVMKPASDAAREDPIKEEKRIKALKDWWTEERREQKSRDLIEYNKIHGTQRYTDALNKRWEEMPADKYEAFCETMSRVNKDPVKIMKAKKTIKDRWKYDEEFKERMILSMKNGKRSGSQGRALSARWKDPDFKIRQILLRKLSMIKKKAPDEIKFLLSNMEDDEILEKFEHLSRKPVVSKIPNKELKNRIEVDIIKLYKSIKNINKDPITNRGWYRTSTENLKNIIIEYYNRYGLLQEYEKEIKEILNETNKN